MSTCGRPVARRRADQRRQPVQRLRPEHHVDVRRACDDRGAFLARDAAADADDQVRPLALERLDPAEVGEHLLLRLLAHRAGVEQDDVGFGRIVGERRSPSVTGQQVAIRPLSYSFIWQPKVRR